jgi:2-polyprenyl-6-hydroxyphenyl methylase/3-demethylubiquinone-9 3-methyltransferase
LTGIDLSAKAIGVARLHQYESGSTVDYRHAAAEALALSAGAFDVVACQGCSARAQPDSTVAACAALAKPGGIVVFSTINRNRSRMCRRYWAPVSAAPAAARYS